MILKFKPFPACVIAHLAANYARRDCMREGETHARYWGTDRARWMMEYLVALAKGYPEWARAFKRGGAN